MSEIFSSVAPFEKTSHFVSLFWFYEELIWFLIVALSQYHLWLQQESVVLYPRHHRCLKASAVNGRCWLLFVFAVEAFLSPLLITKMSIITWFAMGEDLFKWCTLPNVALTLSVSFPVFKQSIDSLSIVLFFMLNDVPALCLTSVSLSISSLYCWIFQLIISSFLQAFLTCLDDPCFLIHLKLEK